MKSTYPFCFLVVFLLGGCATSTTIDYDRAALSNFANYQCFVIDSREARSDYQDVVLSPIVDRRIEAALSAELKAKGFSNECTTPDFRVTFNTLTKTKTRINDIGGGIPPFRKFPYYGYSSYNSIKIEEYEEGTFIVDIIDIRSRELVWRGAKKKHLGWSAPTDEEVREIVAEILEEFPPQLETM